MTNHFTNVDNPYAAPEAPVGLSADDPLDARIASPGWRFVAFMCDYLLSVGLGWGLFAFTMILTGRGMPEPLGESRLAQELNLPVVSFTVLGWIIYSAVLESSLWQATLGKRLCKLYVASRDGARISFGRGIGRAFLKLVGFAPCYVGGALPLLFTRGRFTFQDLVARTVVLRGTPAKPIASD